MLGNLLAILGQVACADDRAARGAPLRADLLLEFADEDVPGDAFLRSQPGGVNFLRLFQKRARLTQAAGASLVGEIGQFVIMVMDAQDGGVLGVFPHPGGPHAIRQVRQQRRRPLGGAGIPRRGLAVLLAPDAEGEFHGRSG